MYSILNFCIILCKYILIKYFLDNNLILNFLVILFVVFLNFWLLYVVVVFF